MEDDNENRSTDTAIYHEQCSTATCISISNRSSSHQVLGQPTMSLWKADWLLEWQHMDLPAPQDIPVIQSGCSHDCRDPYIRFFQNMVKMGLASPCHAHKDNPDSWEQVTGLSNDGKVDMQKGSTMSIVTPKCG